jgi:hypothetical protein
MEKRRNEAKQNKLKNLKGGNYEYTRKIEILER